METYEGDPGLFAKRGAGDDKLFVQFRRGVQHDPTASSQAGRPIYKDTIYVKIVIPGDKSNIVDRPMRDDDKRRFPQQWAAFQAGHEGDDQTVGTRLTHWPPISRALAEELAYLKILTVEQLAACRDDIVSKVPGLTKYKQTAQDWLERSEKTAEATKLQKALEERDSQLAAMNEALKDLQAEVQQLRKSRTKAA